MLKRSCKSEHSCLTPNLSGKGLSFWPLAVDFFVDILYQVEVVPPLFLSLRRDFIMKVLNFVKHFFCTIDTILWFSFFSLLIWQFTGINFQRLNQTCIADINPNWPCCRILLTHCCIWFVNTLLRNFHIYVSWKILVCSFLFL